MSEQFFISDCIVVWRAWNLWRRSKIVLVTSGILLFITIGRCRPLSRLQCQSTVHFPALFLSAAIIFAINNDLDETKSGTALPLYLILVLATSIVTNFYTTILVAIRTWCASFPSAAATGLMPGDLLGNQAVPARYQC